MILPRPVLNGQPGAAQRMNKKILVIDDEPEMCSLVKKCLAGYGFAVVAAHSGAEGVILAREARPDLVLVDAEMPDLDGFAVCRALRKDPQTRHLPVILMSGRKIEERDQLAGFEGGADEYVLKPLSMPLLRARIEVFLKRGAGSEQPRMALKKGGIELDWAGRTAKAQGEPLALSPKEFDLLAVLMEKSGRVLSVPYLLETVWGYDPADYNDPSTVEVHVSRLRKKLGGRLGRRIVNAAGYGYKFEAQ